MAKKFGKFLLITAAVGTAAAAAYYYMKKKDSALTESLDTDEDYDDFSEDMDNEETPRSYVALNRDTATDTDEPAQQEDTFTPLAEQVAQNTEEALDETVEEFFDEEDPTEEEPSIDAN